MLIKAHPSRAHLYEDVLHVENPHRAHFEHRKAKLHTTQCSVGLRRTLVNSPRRCMLAHNCLQCMLVKIAQRYMLVQNIQMLVHNIQRCMAGPAVLPVNIRPSLPGTR
jgi:hypothetical protein